MIKHVAIATLLAAVIASPASADTKKESGQDVPWTYAEFQLDCETSGGKAVFVKGTAACDYPGHDDIVCDAGGGSVGACTPGTIFGRILRPNDRIGRANGNQKARSDTTAPSPTTSTLAPDSRATRDIVLPGNSSVLRKQAIRLR